ncbi:ABC transporter permease [Aureimonas frigidaquae]|uniref:ABC transporter permease n=1 Tax=Aureimonas frigidaquae TaxID=424757 RepID=UPI000781AC83|nr:ABC transporter permease [Aureimonas frigidaquae]
MTALARTLAVHGGAALIAPALFYLSLVYLAPLLWLLARSVIGADGPTLAPYVDLLSDPFTWQVIGNTLRIAALVTLLTLVIGYPTAIALSRARGWPQILLLVAIILPLSVGVVVKAFAWQIVLARNGVIGQLLVATGLFEQAPQLLFTQAGLVVGAANVFLPFMILPIYSVLNLMDPRLPEAAATMGASPFYRFTRVTLPLTLPGIVAGAAFVFSMSVSMYVIPSLLIGDRFQTLATLTGRSFLFMRNEQLGSTTAVLLLVLSVAIILAASALARRVGGMR